MAVEQGIYISLSVLLFAGLLAALRASRRRATQKVWLPIVIEAMGNEGGKIQRALEVERERDGIPVIFEIRNITAGKSYIGHTPKSFGITWAEIFIFKRNLTPEFSELIDQCRGDEWEFCILEALDDPARGREDAYVATRLKSWIRKLNTIKDGYNTEMDEKEGAQS